MEHGVQVQSTLRREQVATRNAAAAALLVESGRRDGRKDRRHEMRMIP